MVHVDQSCEKRSMMDFLVDLLMLQMETIEVIKSMARLTRSDFNTDAFATAGNPCLNRSLIETERNFFGSTSEETFTESGEDCDMSLPCREKALLLMDKRTCFSRSFFVP